MSLSEDELKAIENRAAAASAGPWKAWRCTDSECALAPHWDIYQPYDPDGDSGDGIADVGAASDDPTVGEGDATFIAHAREDVPRMAKDIRRLHSLLERAARSLDYPDWLERELDLYIFGKSDISADND